MLLRLAVSLAAALAAAEPTPVYNGFNLVWQATFPGNAGEFVNTNNWNAITGRGANNEQQTYTATTQNIQISGGGTIQLIPRRDANGAWTSGRVESKYAFIPADGKITRAEAKISFGKNAVGNKKGLWPAFWMLGDAIRQGVPWPQCGEIDAMETVNGQLTGFGTIHCHVYPGGICNEPSGIGAGVGIANQDWHIWRVEWDRRPGDWQSEMMTWFVDDQPFHSVSGARVGDLGVWNSLTAAPLFFILNMAVGGDWPGPPDGNTQDGFGSMLEVAYVAHYVS